MRRVGLWRFKRLLDQQSLGMSDDVWRRADLGVTGDGGNSGLLGRRERA